MFEYWTHPLYPKITKLYDDGTITFNDFYDFINDGIIPSGLQPSKDIGQQQTDQHLKKLEQRIRKEFNTAQADVHKKLRAYLEQTESQRKLEYQKWMNGEITKKDYMDWVYRHEMVGNRWKDLRKELAEVYHHSNEVALAMAKGEMPNIFALNVNWATYQIEHDGQINTGLTLYNYDTAAYLLKDQRQLMPKPSTKKAQEIAANKDMQWNEQKIQSAVLQGVLQGESPYAVANRLQSVADMNYNAAVRYARTMTTSAQNAGRYESYHRAEELGVDLTIEWQATLDHRTRHDHRMMHGQRTEVDEPFYTPDGYTIYYPADCTGESNAPQKEIWNCRCTLLAWVKGYEGNTVKDSPKMGEMTFEEWQNEKAGGFTNNQKDSTIIDNAIADDTFSEARKAQALRFEDRYEADKYYRPKLDENWDNMTDFEKYSVWEYTSNSNPINKSLSGYHDSWSRDSYVGVENSVWGHENPWRSFNTERFTRKYATDGHKDFHKVITNLTTGIDKNVLQDDVWLRRGGGFGGLASLAQGAGIDYDEAYRIISRGTKQEKESLKQMLIGQPCIEHSFISTGIAKDAGFQSLVSYDIYAPKGTKAVYAEPASYYGGTIGSKEKIYATGHTFSGNVGGEAEIIIQRGTKYRLTDIEFEDYDIKVTMEVYSQPDYFEHGDEDTYNNGKTRHKK